MKDKPVGDSGNPLNDLLGRLFGGDLPDDVMIQAVVNDQRLQKLAEYDITKGYIKIKGITPETVQDRFSEFKMLVLGKESTIAELESSIYGKYGIQEKSRELAPTSERAAREPIGFNVMDEEPKQRIKTTINPN